MCHAMHKSGHFSRLLVPTRQGGSALLDQPARPVELPIRSSFINATRVADRL